MVPGGLVRAPVLAGLTLAASIHEFDGASFPGSTWLDGSVERFDA